MSYDISCPPINKFVGLGGCPRIGIFPQVEAFWKNNRSHVFDITNIAFSK
jgi:hypothetical protein